MGSLSGQTMSLHPTFVWGQGAGEGGGGGEGEGEEEGGAVRSPGEMGRGREPLPPAVCADSQDTPRELAHKLKEL